MITVEEARTHILRHFKPLEPERVNLLDALDRVLAEDVVSDLNMPPFDNSAMDGYALRAEDIEGASRARPITLRVIGDIAAGYVPQKKIGRGESMRIMTGAPMPEGADAVVRFEETSEGVEKRGTGKNSASVEIWKAGPRGDNVRHAGEDVQSGAVVLARGSTLTAAGIGVLAMVGKKEVAMHRRPRVAVLATGDELVDVDQPVTPGKIRNSNEYSNTAAVIRAGGIPVRLGIARDNIKDLTAKIRSGLDADVDMFLTSAGVSMGDYDMVKDVLGAEGEMAFWQVKMKPGKPLAFGVLRGHKPVPILGLPGNPVSSIVSFEVFARPAILTMLGKTKFTRPSVRAILQNEATNNADRRNFIRVWVERKDGQLLARTTGEQGSGILTSIAKANGLLTMPEDLFLIPPGTEVEIQMLDWPEFE